jgi:hypothetical protein
MSDHLSDEELNRYRSRMMAPVDLLAANDHLAVCDMCYARFGGDYVQAAYDLARASLRPGSEDAVRAEQESERAVAIKSPGVLAGIVAAIRRQVNPGFIQVAAGVIITAGVTGGLAVLTMRNEPDQSGVAIEERRAAMGRMEVELSRLREQNAALERELKSSRDKIAGLESRLSPGAELVALEGKLKSSRDEIAGLESRLSPGANLAAGAATRPASRVVLSLNDGANVVTMDSSGRLAGLKSLSQSHERLVKTVLATGRVKTPRLLARLMWSQGGFPQWQGDYAKSLKYYQEARRRTLMGAGRDADPYPLLSPVGTAVAGERPTFRWRALDGATSYLVGVYDTKMNEVVASQPLQETEWTATRPLRRGEIYTWQVRAVRDGAEIRLPAPDLPNAKFLVIGTSTAQELERARGAYGSSPLVSGILYANAGLLDEAESELEKVVSANPQSRLAEQLLNSLRAAREK